MSLEDQLGVDPQQIASDLLAQHQPSFAQNQAVDPQTVATRLLRQFAPPHRTTPVGSNLQTKKPVDYGSYGKDADEPPVDYGSYGRDVDEKPEETGSTLGYVGREAAQTLTKGVGAIPKVVAQAPEMAKGLIGAAITPETMMGEAAGLPGTPIPGTPEYDELQQKTQAAAQTVQQPITAVQNAWGPVQQRAPYRVGQAFEDVGKQQFPVTEQERKEHPYLGPVVRGLAGAVPAVAGGIAATAVGGPVAGAATGAAIMGVQQAADTFDEAKPEYLKKAKEQGLKGEEADHWSDEQAAKAAGFAGGVATATGFVPMSTILAPAKKLAPGLMGKLWAIGTQAAKTGAEFTGIGEVQQYVGAQLAKDYDPNAHYDFDYKRVVGEFMTGAIFGAAHPITGIIAERRAEKQSQADFDKWSDDMRQRHGPGDTTRTQNDDGSWSWKYTPDPKAQQAKTDAQYETWAKAQQEKYGNGTGTRTKNEDGTETWHWHYRKPGGGEGDATSGAGAGGGGPGPEPGTGGGGAGAGGPGPFPGSTDNGDGTYTDSFGIRRDNKTHQRSTSGEQERQEQWRQYQEGQRQQQQGAGAGSAGSAGSAESAAARGEWAKQWGTTPPPTPEETAKFEQQKAAFTSKTSKGLYGAMRGFGFTDEDLANANTKDLRDYVRDADILTRHGFSKDEIAGMSPKDMRDALDEAQGHGASFAEEPGAEQPEAEQAQAEQPKAEEPAAAKPAEPEPPYKEGGTGPEQAKTTPESAKTTPETKPDTAPIEQALEQVGEKPSDFPPELIELAARIRAGGVDPPDAFQHAVILHAIDTGALTEEQARQVYGDKKITALLQSRPASAVELPAPTRGAGAGGEAATVAAGQAPEVQRPEGVQGVGKAGEGGQPGGEAAGGVSETAAAGGPAAGAAEAIRPAAVRPAAGGERATEAGGRPEPAVPAEHPAEHEPAKPAAEAPVEKKPKPALSLVQFLASRGGIAHNDPLVKDVQAIIGRKNMFVPGYGPLIRKTGMGLDKAREAAVEAKYIHDIGAISNKPATSTINTLLEHLENEIRGQKQYPAGEEPTGPTAEQRERAKEQKTEAEEAKTRVIAAMKAIKYPIEGVTPRDLDRMAEAVVQHGFEDPLDAIEHVYMQAARDEDIVTPEQIDHLEIGDAFDAVEPTPAHAAGEADREERAASAEAEARTGTEAGGAGPRAGPPSGKQPGERPGGEAGKPGATRAAGEPVTEPGAEGKPQLVLPGAERISDAELAKRRATERLKPKVEQKTAEFGLFGETRKQEEMFPPRAAPAETAKEAEKPTGPPEAGGAPEKPPQESPEPKAPLPGPSESKVSPAKSPLSDMAVHIENAYRDFASMLSEEHGLSADTARKVTEFYLKKKLAKLDPGIGRITVKHGAYLDERAIKKAVAIVRKAEPESRGLAAPAPEAGPSASKPLSVDQATKNLVVSRETHHKIKRKLDAIDEKLEGKQPKPRNALDKERLDRTREFQERIARSLRKKEAAAMDAVDDAKTALKEAQAAPKAPPPKAPAAETTPAPHPAPTEKPSGEMPEIPEFLDRRKPPKPGPAGLSAPESRLSAKEINAEYARILRDLEPGTFRPDRNQPLGGQAQSHVLTRGLETRHEHMVAIGPDGSTISETEGDGKRINLSPTLLRRLQDPRTRAVLHHNHPETSDDLLSGVGLPSLSDLGALGNPGVEGMWAHGEDGHSTRLELIKETNDVLTEAGLVTGEERGKLLFDLADQIEESLEAPSVNAMLAGASAKDAELALVHMRNLILEQAGVLHYHHNVDLGDYIERYGFEPDIQRAISAVRKAMFNEVRPHQAVHNAAPAVPLRHPGDVGTSLELPAKPAGRYLQQAGGNRAGREAARAPEGYGQPAGALEAPFDRLRERISDLLNSGAAVRGIEGVYDLSHRVKLLRDEVQARMMGVMPDSQDFYTRKRLFPGRVSNLVREFDGKHLDPLVKMLKANGISLQEAATYLYARHAPERNAAMDKINPKLGGAGSGMTDQEAAHIIAMAHRGNQASAYRELASSVDNINNWILRLMEKAGLEKPETIQAWRDQYSHYVPLRGWEVPPEDAPEQTRGTGAGFNIRGREVQRAFGRRSKADNPLTNLINQAYVTIQRAEKNRYLQSVYRALDALGPQEGKDIASLDKGKPKREIDPETGLVRYVETSNQYANPNAVYLKFGGNPHFIVFKNRKLGEAVKRLSPDDLGPAQFLLTLQNKLKAIWTHYSPDFLARHFLARYPIEGTLNSFELKESGEHKVRQYVKDAVPFLGNASRAIFASNKAKRLADPELKQMQDYWDEMRKAGGAMMFRNRRDMDLLREHLETQLMALKGRPIATVRERWRRGVEAMDVVTNALDNSLRLAAYAAARKQGKSIEQAALIAREATVDFQVKGKWSNMIAIWAPFGSVANATAARGAKMLHRSRIMRRRFGATILAGFLTAAFNYLIGGNDTDGVPFFDKLGEWERRLNFIVLNPFIKDEKGRPYPMKLPMPYFWSIPLTLGYAFGNMVFGNRKIGHALGMVTHSLIEGLTPLGNEANVGALAAPELTRPIVHVATNEDWAGRNVHRSAEGVSRYSDYAQHAPNAYTPLPGKRAAGGLYPYIARGLNYATGGRPNKSGLLDLYPEDIRELLGYMVSTPLREVAEVGTTAKSILRLEKPDPTQVPIGRVFFGTDYDAANRALRFERSKKAQQPWTR